MSQNSSLDIKNTPRSLKDLSKGNTVAANLAMYAEDT